MSGYRFELVCPDCKRTGEAFGTKETHPSLMCPDCLMNEVEIVPMTVVRVTVLDSSDEPV